MSKFKVGDKVALKNSPCVKLGTIDSDVFGYYLIDIGNDSYKMVDGDDIVLIEEMPNLSDDQIYNMLKPKMDNILHWHSVESIKTDPFPSQLRERMIEWHKAKDELPPCDTPVLVAGSDTDGTYPEEYVHLMKMFVKHSPDGDENVWQCVYDLDIYEVYEDDQWAYINLPEKDGGSD